MENSMTSTKTYSYGDFFLFFSYYKDEPVMGIANKTFKKERRRAWIIPLSNAWQYANSQSGEPSPYLVEQSIHIGHLLGLGNDSRTLYTIASAIVDALSDLIKMPPKRTSTTDGIVNNAVKEVVKLTVE
jgi:hypothetical protein